MKKQKSVIDEILLGSEFTKLSKFDEIKFNISLLYRSFVGKLKDTAAVIKGERLSANKVYEGASRVKQEEVESNPRRWIIEECVPACEILWNKNIYTFMCSDSLDKNAWIELVLENLSEENLAILEEIKSEYICYQYHKGCINISVNGMGKSAQDELIEVATRFKMQDVPKNEATIRIDDLFIASGCYKEVPNPKYRPLKEQLEEMTLEDWDAAVEPETLRVFDISKLNKPIKDYIEDYGGVLDEQGVIYRSQFHYDKHLKYLECMKEKEINPGLKK